jgi:hypothetical protein
MLPFKSSPKLLQKPSPVPKSHSNPFASSFSFRHLPSPIFRFASPPTSLSLNTVESTGYQNAGNANFDLWDKRHEYQYQVLAE